MTSFAVSVLTLVAVVLGTPPTAQTTSLIVDDPASCAVLGARYRELILKDPKILAVTWYCSEVQVNEGPPPGAT